MKTPLHTKLTTLLDAYVGHEHLRTPLLNRLQVLGETVSRTAQSLQALARDAPVLDADKGLGAGQLPTASAQYWSDLAPGTEMSRLDHARALRAEDLGHRAHVLAALGEITPVGQQLLAEALAPADDRPAPSAYAIALTTTDSTRLTLPGVELIQSPASDRCLLVWPGVGQQLFEFDSRREAGLGLIEYLLGEQGAEFWACFEPDVPAHWHNPPFAGLGVKAGFGLCKDAVLLNGVKSSIASELHVQINRSSPPADWAEQRVQRFWQPLPEVIQSVLASAIKADGARQASLLTFGSIGPDIATALVAQTITACETGIQRYIGDELGSQEHKRYRQVHAAWQAAQAKAREQVGGLSAHARFPHERWARVDEAGLTPRQHLALALTNALRHDAQLQVYEGTLSSADLALISEVLAQPAAAQRQASGTVVAEIAVGPGSFSYRLPGAYVIAPATAWSKSTEDVRCLLYLAGEEGGLRRFDNLTQLLGCVTASLKDPAFTPLWARYKPSAQTAIKRFLNQSPLPLVTRPVALDWMDSYLGTEIDSHEDLLAAAATDRQRREQVLDELTRALAAPAHEVRDVAVNRIAEQRRLQSTLQALPAWLATAAKSVRTAYAELLDRYNPLATAQEHFLQRQTPLIRDFARSRLKARLKAELDKVVDPEQVLVKLPESVELKAVANVPSEVVVPSATLETMTLVELALLNIDRQVTLRLRYATLVARDSGVPLSIQGLTIARLRRLIIELDVAGQYRRHVQGLFSLPTDLTGGASVRAQLLTAPYAAALRLQAYGDYQRGLLDKSGWQWLEKALCARTAEQLAEPSLDMRLSTAVLSLGEGDDKLASGLLLLTRTGNGECWLYLPKVPEGASFVHGVSADAARQTLLRRLRSTSMRTWLAGLAGVGHATASRERYLEQACQRDFTGFMRFAPLAFAHWPVAAALLHNRQQQLLNDAQLIARTRADIRQAFAQQLRDGGRQLAMSGLYYLPGIGTLLQLYDGWTDAHDAINAFAGGDTAVGLRRMASAELNFGFALMSFVPGMAAARLTRRALQPRQARQPTALPVGRKLVRVDGFAGHAVDIDLLGATPQTGMDAGTWMRNRKLYLWQDGKAYEVFRRGGELTLRLRRTSANSHEHPVRRGPDGRFHTHLDTGLRAGGRSRAGSASSASGADESPMAPYLIASEDRAIMADLLPRAGKYTLDERGGTLGPVRPGDQARGRFFVKRQQLLQDADEHLRTVVVEPRVDMPLLSEDATHGQLIAAIYQKSNGLVIGEAHASSSSKRFLIDNFATLKAEGVKTLYFEHLHMDFLASELKVLNDTGVLTPALRQHLRTLDRGHRVDTGQPFTFENVIVAANEHGLQVVSLDCAASWYSKGVADRGVGARQRMFSYLASQVIQAHQSASGEHKWVALVGNSHSNRHAGTLGLAELNKAIGVRMAEPQGGIPPRWRPDPGLDTSFNRGRVQADFLLEVQVPPAGQSSASPLPSLSAADQALAAQARALLDAPIAALRPATPRLIHPGSFYLEKVGDQRVVVHLSRDGNTYRTPVDKRLGGYSVSRPSWDKVHGRRFWTLRGLLEAMAEQNLTHVTV
jgi:hypothetical protein